MASVLLCRELLAVLEEQLSLKQTSKSLNKSLNSLKEQIKIPETWKSLRFTEIPELEFVHVIHSKMATIAAELTKLR